MTNHAPLRVVKVGGSLFDLPNLADRIQAWVASQAPARNILVVGGGPLVDVLRILDRTHALGESACHWLAIDLMDIAARALSVSIPDAVVLNDVSDIALDLGAEECSTLSIFLVGRFLREAEPISSGTKLPANWSVTSDSIAARLAIVLDADELVLFKSSPPDRALASQSSAPSTTQEHIVALSASGYVDAYFAELASSAPRIRFVDLRGKSLATQ